jgi:tyrosine-specific transport protein
MNERASLVRRLGAALIITGTCIGAGMLVIPLTTAALGFVFASILLLVIALLMTATAFLIAEVNLDMPDGTNFSTMAKMTLGRPGQIVAWISFLLLMYALTAAYTAQGSSLLGVWLSDVNIITPMWFNSLIYIFIMGAFVYTGAFAVDCINKFLIIFKFLAFFSLAIFISPYVQKTLIMAKTSNIDYLWITLPLLITSFGYHTVLPSMRSYLHSNKKDLYTAIILGGFVIPMLVYIVWEAITLGTIPLFSNSNNSFEYIVNHGNDITALIATYHSSYNLFSLDAFATTFTSIAITTSFLGVTLGLFNFNQDTYKLTKTNHKSKMLVFAITYLPPFIFAVYYPRGFVMALGYASIFVAILLISLPAMMAWKVRQKKGTNTLLSKAYLTIIVLAGLLMIVLQIGTQLNLLPSFV